MKEDAKQQVLDDCYYEIHGAGRPLVLLHGATQTIDRCFGPLLSPLAAVRQVIAIEFQGHGRTPDTDRPLTVGNLAGDVVALLDQLDITTADLFGFSLGGLVALDVALTNPARVGRLVLAAVGHRPMAMPNRTAKTDDKLMASARDFRGWSDDELRTLAPPTLLLVGDRDTRCLAQSRELATLNPAVKLAVLIDAGHRDLMGHTDELTNLVVPFLAQDTSSSQ